MQHFDFNSPQVENFRVYMRICNYFNPCWNVNKGRVAELNWTRVEFQLSLLHVNAMKAYTIKRVETRPVFNSTRVEISHRKGLLDQCFSTTVPRHTSVPWDIIWCTVGNYLSLIPARISALCSSKKAQVSHCMSRNMNDYKIIFLCVLCCQYRLKSFIF